MSTYLTRGVQVYTRLDINALAKHQEASKKEAMRSLMEFNKLMMDFKMKYDNKTLTYVEGMEIIRKVANIREEIFDLMTNQNTNKSTYEHIKQLHEAVKKGRLSLFIKLENLLYAA